jgi:thiamine biosynthesis lipoprotein ApbE
MDRRSFLTLPLIAPLASLSSLRETPVSRLCRFPVMGTSLDFAAWGPRVEAERAGGLVLDEIGRLAARLSTYDEEAEMSRLARGEWAAPASPEARDLLAAYDQWEHRTGGAISARLRGGLNVDALGKAFIIDRAATAARRGAPALHGLLLDVGGDIVIAGTTCRIGVANPRAGHDNAPPLTVLTVANAAVATSGGYERTGHLYDPRSGERATGACSATVVAPDCVTANALSTAACVLPPGDSLAFVESVRGAACLIVAGDGREYRSAGLSAVERRPLRKPVPTALWPPGHQLTCTLTLSAPATEPGGRGRKPKPAKRPYAAVWAEDLAGRPGAARRSAGH